MTGTADTEAFEFQDIYNLETIVIPTNKPVQRQDNLDEVYLTKEIKDKAILADIEYCYKLQKSPEELAIKYFEVSSGEQIWLDKLAKVSAELSGLNMAP